MTADLVRRWVAPVLLGLLALVVWQAVVVGAGIKPYLLPSPTAIVEQLVLVLPLVWAAALATGMNVLVGLVVGSLVAIGAAIVAARSRMADTLLSPTAAALSVMPIVALAPALNTMFGTTSTTRGGWWCRSWSSRRCSSTRCAGCVRSSRFTVTC